ncbi:MAG: tetratricopeptide repeat protein [Vicinamibacterales bacterium]
MKLRSSVAGLALAAGLGVAVAGCGQVNMVRAQKVFKDANKLYAASDWRAAAAKYQEAIDLSADDNPNKGYSYFFLANCLDNMYRPTRAGEAENDALLTRAIDNYKRASESIADPLWKRRSLEFLVAAYGPDKLNDPTMAEPIVKQMISLEPNEPSHYFSLARIYEDSGEYELAEETLAQAKNARPNDPSVQSFIAGYYERQGEFEKMLAALEDRVKLEPNNPEAYYSMSVAYWQWGRDLRLTEPQRLEKVLLGLEAADKAIQIKSDYMEAIAYKNILLRVQATLIKDPAKQQQLLREADELRNRAEEMRKAKNTATN